MEWLPPDSYPYLLPHMSVHEEGLFIGAQHLGECEDVDRRVLQACDGRISNRELQSRFPAFQLSENSRAAREFIIGLQRSFESGQPAGNERVLVLSPQPHVGFLSLAGYLINRRDSVDCTYVSCFSRVNATSTPEAFPLEQDVCAIRRDETAICAKLVGCRNLVFWDYPAHDVRSVGPGLHGTDPTALSGISEKEMRQVASKRLYQYIQKCQPQHVFGPAGLGDPDHRMLFDILLDFFKQSWFPDIHFHCYEDYPFSSDYINVDEFLSRFESAYAFPQSWDEDVTDAWTAKCTLVDIYKSLFSDSEKEKMLRVAARNGAGRSLREQYWLLTEWR